MTLRGLAVALLAWAPLSSAWAQAPASTTPFAATGGTVARSPADRAADVVDAKDHGAKCDGVTDDTASLQAAIDAAQATGSTTGVAQKKLVLPGGQCDVSGAGLRVTRPIYMEGQGSGVTVLKGALGMTAPILTVAPAYDSADYFSSGSPFAEERFTHFRIQGASNADKTGTPADQHGIALVRNASKSVYAYYYLTDIDVFDVTGDAFHIVDCHCGGAGYDLRAHLPGNDGFYINSSTDWIITGGYAYGGLDNILISGGVGINIYNMNVFNARHNNLTLYSSTGSQANGIFAGGHLDLAGWHNVYSNLATAGNGAGSMFSIVDTKLRWASQAADRTYSDIFMEAGAAGAISLVDDEFTGPPNPFGPNHYLPKHNIEFKDATSGNVFVDQSTVFDAGNLGTKGVTNSLSQALGSYRNGTIATSALATANTAYTTVVAADRGSTTMSSGQDKLLLLPTGAIAAYAVLLPGSPKDGQVARIATSQAIGMLSVRGGAGGAGMTSGATIKGFAAGQGIEYTYVAGSNSWVKSL